LGSRCGLADVALERCVSVRADFLLTRYRAAPIRPRGHGLRSRRSKSALPPAQRSFFRLSRQSDVGCTGHPTGFRE